MINRVLKLVRQFHRLSQSEMAKRLKISNSYLSEIESEKKDKQKTPTLELLHAYSREFKIPVSTLLLFAERLEGAKSLKLDARSEKLLKFLEWAADEDEEDDAAA